MRILKWFGISVAGLIIVGAGIAYVNWDNLVRLNNVNTLFDEENIVRNFSGMKDIFFYKDIASSGKVVAWEISSRKLPEKFKAGPSNRSLEDWLEQTNTTSLLVVQNGKIAHEEYYRGTTVEDLRISWSVAKSFLSAAFGVAVEDGLIDIDKPVSEYVPEFSASAYKGATVRNVLNMASGIKFNEDYLDFWSDINKMGRVLALSGSMDEFALSMERQEREPGIARQYVSIDTHVLAMVLRSATGKSLVDLISEKIVNPLGFEKQPYYLTDSEGDAFALGGLNITTRDYARFGQMYLNNGKWQGKQVIPAGWVLRSTIKSAPATADPDDFDYGYQWWIPAGSASHGGDYMARGIYGQYIYINPKNGTVIVKTAANRKFREVMSDGMPTPSVDIAMFRAVSDSLASQ